MRIFSDVADLRELYDQVQLMISSLESFGVPAEVCALLLNRLFLRSLLADLILYRKQINI